MPRAITFPQFYEAVGSALGNWVSVEDALCDLFTRLVICSVTGHGMRGIAPEGYWVVPSIFHASQNLKAKIELIDRIFHRLINDATLLAEWDTIKEKQRSLYARRNVMAHGHVLGSNGIADLVTYPMHADSRRKRMTYMQVCGATPAFRIYKDRIEALAIAANKLLGARV